MSKYVVGIDLGTTNCAVSYADCNRPNTAISRFDIPQVIAAGETAERSTLPSFLLLPSQHEVTSGSMDLPWSETSQDYCVGTMAKERGSELPHRLVSSAKSWLSYDGVKRDEDILPWRGNDPRPEDERQISPVQTSARYLQHLRSAWDHKMDAPLAEQTVLLTVPASFDAVARDLTVQAAKAAGLDNVTLLEEPQAAFYSWLAHAKDDWRNQLQAGDTVLVCDIGGGTSDFSLISVENNNGNLELERVAVGEHILLGGDNMDLTLAQVVIQRLGDKGKKLKPAQYRSLVLACARAKESLLGNDGPDSIPISILGSGSKLIGGSLRSELKRDDIDIVLNGFFPTVDSDAKPKQKRTLGLRELGLPYANDPAVTRHLAAFLAKHGKAPNKILWNGGVMKGQRIQQALAQNLATWFAGDLPALSGTDLDLAVAHGAAYYGLVRLGKGIRIRGGTAQTYYIGVEGSAPAIPGFEPPIKALCVAPFGMEEGSTEDLPEEEMGLIVGEAMTFRFFASTSRKQDKVGTLVDPLECELSELAPIQAHLPASTEYPADTLVPVYLAANVTEVGTLELWGYAKEGDGRWKLEYSLRDS